MRKFITLLILLVACVFAANAQTRVITGRVTDSTGNPVEGASILIKGTKTGVAAGADGSFSIQAKKGDVVTISSVNFLPFEIVIDEQPNLIITLGSASGNISEVVVTALGIRRNRNTLPYAAQQVSSTEITKTRTNNFANALSGKVAGLQIRTNNNLGGSTDIILRGYKSITGDNQALIVVDGVPVNNTNFNSANQTQGFGGYDYGNTGADLNPDDIESVNVLKGAASTALYGSRASNGVIVITTKKGRKGLGVTVNLGGSTGRMDKSTFMHYQHQYGAGYYDADINRYSGPEPSTGLPPAQYAQFLSYDVNGDGVDDLVVPTTEDASFGAEFDPNLLVYQWTAFDPSSPNYLKATPWVAAKNDPTSFFENPYSYSTSVFVNGGGDRANFKLGYTKNDDKGFLPNSRLRKDLLNFQADYKITNNLTANATVNFTKTGGVGRYGNGYGDANSIAGNFREWWEMNVDVKDLEAAYDRTKSNITWNVASPPEDISPAYWDNPYFVRYKSFESDSRYRYLSIVSLNYNVNSWLNILGRASLDSYDQLQEERNGYGSINIASYNRFNQTFREYNYDLFANVNKDFSKKLNFKALLGGNLRRDFAKSIFASTNGGLILPDIYSLANSSNPIEAPIETDQKIEVGRVFAGVTFTYNDMLILDATASRDQSSTLPKGNNSYFYPSVSGGFVFSKLLPNETWLNLGKLRLNYAQVGKDAPFNYVQNTYSQPTPFGSTPLFSVSSTLKNADLKPEKTRSIEAGLEASFLKNRLGFDVTLYKTNTIDEIIPVTISASTGYITQIINAGNVQNKGIEVSLNLVPIRTNNFTWNINVNWSKIRNKILSLTNGTQNILLGTFQGGVTLNAAVGQPFGTLRGSTYADTLGQHIVDDGYYRVTQSTNNIIGNINPDWLGGINNSFTYKQVSLSFLIDAKKGGSVYSIDQWYGQGTGLTMNTVGNNELGNPIRSSAADGGGLLFPGVTEEGKPNATRANITGLQGFGYNNFPNAGSIYDAGYVKLREVNLTYSLPKKLISKTGVFKGIDVSVYGRNLWIIHKNLPDADPEDVSSSGNVQGYQVGSYPTYRNMGFNLKFQF